MNKQNNKDDNEVPLLRTGIAWPSDKNIKFRNPPAPAGCKENCVKAAFELLNFTKPKAWQQHIYELDLENDDNNGFQNEDFIVWMRTAALPVFRKLYRRINHDKKDAGYTNGLRKGDYELRVEYSKYVIHKFQM